MAVRAIRETLNLPLSWYDNSGNALICPRRFVIFGVDSPMRGKQRYTDP